jgi:energy-coupling factor transporter transmembrane protein EcfT
MICWLSVASHHLPKAADFSIRSLIWKTAAQTAIITSSSTILVRGMASLSSPANSIPKT